MVRLNFVLRGSVWNVDLKTTQRYISDDPELLRSLVENGPVDAKRTQLSLPPPDIFSAADKRTDLYKRLSDRSRNDE